MQTIEQIDRYIAEAHRRLNRAEERGDIEHVELYNNAIDELLDARNALQEAS